MLPTGAVREQVLNLTAGGKEMHTLSLLVLTMTFLLLQTGIADPVGITALALQVGLLVRINALHGADRA